MSRNVQVGRQWLLLERLERSKGATLEQLAESLPPDGSCHPRTIRRDLEALEARFPLVTERRHGKTVWHLMEGYDRSLRLAFSQTELMALVFSKDLLRPLDGTELKSALDSAFNKMVAALPSDGASFVGRLRDFFSVGLGPHKRYKDHRQTIDCLTRAISQSRTVNLPSNDRLRGDEQSEGHERFRRRPPLRRESGNRRSGCASNGRSRSAWRRREVAGLVQGRGGLV